MRHIRSLTCYRAFGPFALALALSGCTAASSPAENDGNDEEAIGSDRGDSNAIPRLPQDGAGSGSIPWGGENTAAWAPESVFANAVSRELNQSWAAGVSDVTIAIPLTIQGSELFPYGDGQSNAAASFGGWSEKRPPVIAALRTYKDGMREVTLRLSGALSLAEAGIELTYTTKAGASRTARLAGTPAQGDTLFAWEVPSDAVVNAENAPMTVRPAGWQDVWPLHFYHPAYAVSDMVSDVPQALRTFSDGRSIPDPEGIAGGTGSAFTRLMSHGFGPGYNQQPYLAPNIHGSYPNRPNTASAVGSSWAWVAAPPQAPFKQLYLCMEGRRYDAERTLGVPTGSGWHKIGDAAESLLNSLEDTSLLAAWAAPVKKSATISGFAYGLDHVATARLLRPGEALMTARGTTTTPRYHWYLNHSSDPVCAEIWVHPCPPTERFACTSVDVTFTASGAETTSGQNVYILGSIPELGSWNPSAAVKMDPLFYPTWIKAVPIAPGTAFSYKFIKRNTSGQVIWESGENRQATAPYAEYADVGGAWR